LANDPVNKDLTTAGSNWVVIIAKNSALYN